MVTQISVLETLGRTELSTSNLTSSERYRTQFNRVAKEQGYNFEWKTDTQNLFVIDPNELFLNETPTALFDNNLTTQVKKVIFQVEEERQTAVENAYNTVDWQDFNPDYSALSEDEKEAIRILGNRVAPLIDQIYLQQADPLALSYGNDIQTFGSEAEQSQYTRTLTDQCVGLAEGFSPVCSLLPYYPDKPAINNMLASTISLEEFSGLSETLDSNDPILRSDTVVEEKTPGNYTAIPLPLHPDYREAHLQLADALEDIAALNVDPALQTQMRAWAQYFRTGSSDDKALAVQATIDAGESDSNVRVHLGDSESYWPDNTKFPYLLQVGLVNQDIKTSLSNNKDLFLAMEASLAEFAGYTPRELSLRGGFADPIEQVIVAGFIGAFVVEPQGNNYPNEDYGTPNVKVEGSNRFLLLEAFALVPPNLIALNTLLTDNITEDTWGDVKNLFLEFVVDHESGHLLGPSRSHVTPSGNTMGIAFGKHWSSAEEAKADMTFGVKLNMSDLPQAEKEAKIRSLVARSLSPLYPGKAAYLPDETGNVNVSAHRFGVGLMVGYFFKTGAYKMVETANGPQIEVDYAKVLKSSQELWEIIIGYQAQGDVDGFMAFSQDTVAQIPDVMDQTILETLAANKKNRTLLKRHLPE